MLQTSPSTSLTRIGRRELGQVDCTDEPHTPYLDWANLTRPWKDSRVGSLEYLYDRRAALLYLTLSPTGFCIRYQQYWSLTYLRLNHLGAPYKVTAQRLASFHNLLCGL
jgi:hypothetical protein